MSTQTPNQIYNETITMAREVVLQALEDTSWMTTLSVAEATRTLSSVERWLQLQPRFKIKENPMMEDDVETIPDDAVEWYSESDDALEVLEIPDCDVEWYSNAAEFWLQKQDDDSIKTAIPDEEDEEDDDDEYDESDGCDEEEGEEDDEDEGEDEPELHGQPMTIKVKPAKIDAELKILEDVADWVRRRPKFKIRTTIKLKPAKIDAELKILEGIHEYIRHLPRLKVRNQPINYEEMFMRKTGLGPEQYEAMQDTWQEIRHRMQDFARCWKQNNYRRSQVLDSKGNIIETCWRNFKARFMISFDQDLEQAIRDYTPRHDATPPPDATGS